MTNSYRLQILLVANIKNFSAALLAELDQYFDLTKIDSVRSNLELIQTQDYDLYLIEYCLSAHKKLHQLYGWAITAKKPVILMVEPQDWNVTMWFDQKGTVNYLLKEQLNGPLLQRAVKDAIARVQFTSIHQHLDSQHFISENSSHFSEAVYLCRSQYESCFRATEGIFVSDAQGNFVEVNSTGYSMLGYSQADINSLSLHDVVCGVDFVVVLTSLAYLSSREPSVMEGQIKRQDGSYIPVEVSAKMLMVDRLQVIVRDISERIQVKQQLQLTREMYRGMLEHAIEGFFQSSLQGFYLSANPALALIYGFASPGELIAQLTNIGQQLYVDPSRRATFMQMMQTQGTVSKFESQVYHQNGSVIWISENVRTIRDAEGKPLYFEGTVVDVTNRKRAEEIILASQERLKHLLSAGPAVIYSSKATGDYGITFVSENITAKLGYTPQEFTQNSQFWVERVHPDDIAHIFAKFARLPEQQHQTVEYRFRHWDGTYRWLQDELKLITDDEGNPLEILGCWHDVTGRKHAELELLKRDRLLQGVAEATNQLLTNSIFDTAIIQALRILGNAAEVDRIYLYENHPHPATGEVAMSMRYEWTKETINPSITKPYWQNQPYSSFGLNRWYECFIQGQSIHGVTRELPEAEQQVLWRDQILAIIMVPILIDDILWGYIGFDDCHTERQWSKSEESILFAMGASIGGAIKRQRIEKQLSHNALHDPLTQIPNRALFQNRLQQALKQTAREPESQFAVLFLDLDRFKVVNDSLGHMMGDELLIAIARVLENCLRPQDTLARLGGDEFTVLLDNIHNVKEVLYVAERIHQQLIQPFHLNGHEIFTSASIGIVLSTSNYHSPEDLLRDANMAMYRAKALGRSRHELFNDSMRIEALTQMQLETELRRAVERQEFQLYYQPIVSLSTGKTVGFEALIRWHHATRGKVSPLEFVPIAEETGLIIPLGTWVLQKACQQLQAWQSQFPQHPPLTMSVNLSRKQFSQPNLIAQIDQILATTGLGAEHLKLEITESLLMENTQSAASMLMQLQQRQIQLSMDDFGTGYSSLSYLHRFPIDILKIDQSFVTQIGSGTQNLEIIRAIMTLAHNLNLSVTAEGIETATQLKQLRSLRCQYGQGYFFAPPLPRAEVEKLLANPPQWW